MGYGKKTLRVNFIYYYNIMGVGGRSIFLLLIFFIFNNFYREIKKFIQEWCPNGCTKLSFIGHSLGGLIIRSAIPHL